MTAPCRHGAHRFDPAPKAAPLAAKMNRLQNGQGHAAQERMADIMAAIERELDSLIDGSMALIPGNGSCR